MSDQLVITYKSGVVSEINVPDCKRFIKNIMEAIDTGIQIYYEDSLIIRVTEIVSLMAAYDLRNRPEAHDFKQPTEHIEK